jgi:hypothetical protein
MFQDRSNHQQTAPAPPAAAGGVSPSATAATIGAVSGARRRARRARRARSLAAAVGGLVALALPAAAHAQVSFSGPTSFAAGDAPVSVAVGDFNGDSDPDLAVTNINSDDVSVLLGDGMGSFSPAANFAAGHVPTSVAVADLNGDGRPDLAVVNQFSNDVLVLVNSTNHAPSGADDAYATAEDTTLTVAAPGVLDNDADPDGDALSAGWSPGRRRHADPERRRLV